MVFAFNLPVNSITLADESASDHGSISESEDEGAGKGHKQNGLPASAQSSDYSYSDSDEEPRTNHKPVANKKVCLQFYAFLLVAYICSHNTEIRSHEMKNLNIAMLLVFAFFQQANRRHMYIVSSIAR